jgi:hypothetical protein
MKKQLDEQIWIARILTYILAFLEICFTLIVAFMKLSDSIIYDLVIAVLFALLFVVLGVWSKEKPFPALLIVTIIFLIDSVIFFVFHPLSIMVIIVRTTIIIFLIRGVNAAMEIQEMKKKETNK